MKKIAVCFLALLIVGLGTNRVVAQAEVSGWGNLRGIRVGGQLVPFTTAVGVFNTNFSQVTLSQREGPIRTSQYLRNGNALTVGEMLQYGSIGARGAAAIPSTNTGANTNGGTNSNRAGGPGRRGGRGGGSGFNYTMTCTDSAPGTCDVSLRLTSTSDQTIGGIYYFLVLPSDDFTDGTVQLIGGKAASATPLKNPDGQGRFLTGSGTGVRLSGKNHQQVEANFGQELAVVVQERRGGNGATSGARDIQVYFPVVVGNTIAGQAIDSHFTLKASGDIETSPVSVTIDPAKPGRTFDGMGGNYRIQSPRDPQVIQYIMDNLRVAFGRVALPWNVWQPEENSPPPLLSVQNGSATNAAEGRSVGMNSIVPAFEIAQKLAQKKIPMIISCWFPPSWAVLGNGGRGGGGGGQRLDPAKWDAICKSLGSYLIYLRDHYGAEPLYFSFNESKIGINVRQSPEEHAEAIKKLGAYFKSIGLKTRMLLGDTGDAIPVNFIQPALNDPEAVQYIGAVSFHSWRGATDEQYQKWADAATRLHIPLFDAEGGNDAQASGYPSVFQEGWYALDEAAEYVRIMRICQPESILEWQLTQDYTVLKSDGNGGFLPTQRFYNLKQFNLTPAGSAWVPAQSSSALVLPAASVDASGKVCTVHLVNNGADRPVTLSGLPAAVTQMSVYVTDQKRGVEKQGAVTVKNGTAQFSLSQQTLTTLVGSSQ